MSISASQVKQEVEKLASIAYFQHLISGYGNGEDPNSYQIVIQGKPRHYSLEEAYSVLVGLLANRFEFDESPAPATASLSAQSPRQLMIH
jgi:hypothetical protein